jgi:hypothetical protein
MTHSTPPADTFHAEAQQGGATPAATPPGAQYGAAAQTGIGAVQGAAAQQSGLAASLLAWLAAGPSSGSQGPAGLGPAAAASLAPAGPEQEAPGGARRRLQKAAAGGAVGAPVVGRAAPLTGSPVATPVTLPAESAPPQLPQLSWRHTTWKPQPGVRPASGAPTAAGLHAPPPLPPRGLRPLQGMGMHKAPSQQAAAPKAAPELEVPRQRLFAAPAPTAGGNAGVGAPGGAAVRGGVNGRPAHGNSSSSVADAVAGGASEVMSIPPVPPAPDGEQLACCSVGMYYQCKGGPKADGAPRRRRCWLS